MRAAVFQGVGEVGSGVERLKVGDRVAPMATSLHIADLAGIGPGDKILVLGAGNLGLGSFTSRGDSVPGGSSWSHGPVDTSTTHVCSARTANPVHTARSPSTRGKATECSPHDINRSVDWTSSVAIASGR
jgi:hypothetical protein